MNDVSEIIKDKLYLTSLDGCRNCLNDNKLCIDIIVSIIDTYKLNILRDRHPNIKFVFYAAADEDDFNITQYFDEFYKLVQDNPGSRILVNCYAGASRSASLVISYMMNHYSNTKKKKVLLKYSTERFIQIVNNKRNVVSPNNGFIQQLRVYLISLQNK